MRNENLRLSVQDNRRGVLEVLRSFAPLPRFVVGLIACAIAAYYVPLILIALTGVWVNSLADAMQLLIVVMVLVIQNLIGNKLNQMLIVSAVFAVLVDGLELYILIRTSSSLVFHRDWMLFFLPTTAFFLNAWLLGQYKRAMALT